MLSLLWILSLYIFIFTLIYIHIYIHMYMCVYTYVYINVHVHVYNGPFSNILNFRVKKILQGISRNLKFFFQLKVFLDWLHAKFVLNVGLWRGQDFIFPLRNSVWSPRWAIATRAGAPQLEIEFHPDKLARGRYNTSKFHIPARHSLVPECTTDEGCFPLSLSATMSWPLITQEDITTRNSKTDFD